MGGCRCTYRNCTVRSDGKTHLFHYPVFDKVRCHQWLTNAGRYDFLHLKVSQLKNRCICQHHFLDRCFMNNMKDKLKLEAIPTEDGPHCDSSKFEAPEMLKNSFGLYPITYEDIENDEYISDRKANYNLKYADFLTNGELMEPIVNNYKNTLDNEEEKKIIKMVINKNEGASNKLEDSIVCHSKPDMSTLTRKKQEEPIPVALFVNDTGKNNLLFRQVKRKKSNITIISEKKITEPENKIPVPALSGAFKIVSPSMVLNISNRKKNSNLNNMGIKKSGSEKESSITHILSHSDPSQFEIKIDMEENIAPPAKKTLVKETQQEENKPVVEVVSHSIENINDNTKNNMTLSLKPPVLQTQQEINIPVVEVVSHSIQNIKDNKNCKINNMPAKESVTDESISIQPTPKITPDKKKNPVGFLSKISPERIAAINEKRKFNMKLKDIIQAGLCCLEEQNKNKSESKFNKRNYINKASSETVATSLSQESSLPGHDEYIVSYLEARMKKMENLLLHKIDQNSQKIMELKRSFDAPKEGTQVSKISTRSTNLHGEAHKKHLYKEISQYLTPDVNSLLYEELFINKYSRNLDAEPLKKRRRR